MPAQKPDSGIYVAALTRFLPLQLRVNLNPMSRSDLVLRAATCALFLAAAGCVTQAPPASPPVVAPNAPAVSATVPSAQPLAIARAAFVRDTAARYSIDPA